MKKRALKKTGRIILAVTAIILIFFLWPLPKSITKHGDNQPVKILDRSGKLLYEVRQENYGTQEYLEYSKIPPDIISILIGIEDQTFRLHPGISARGILRAAWQNQQAGKIVSGGSTITQQLVRIRVKPEKRNYIYKLKEALLAVKLETRMNKNEILESYLNSVYFGHQAYGIQAAARTFFDKNASELSFAESAMLIGLIQSPVSYDPFVNFSLAKKRQQTVLTALKESGKFKGRNFEEIENEPINLSSGKTEILAPHFVMYVMDQLYNQPDNQSEIKTTLDLELQSEIELIVANHLEDLKEKNVTSAAVVVMDAGSGEIMAMIGSADYFDVKHDGAVNVALSPRQPGSALKPFTYALALKNGETAASTVSDIETQFFTQDGNPYTPRNYDYGYHGLVRYREALANSYNIAAVKVLEKVGVKTLMEFLKKAGITTLNKAPEHYGLALTLGDAEVKLFDLVQAYGMLARGGRTITPKWQLNQSGTDNNDQQILDPRIAWIITDILDDDAARLPQFGENGPLEFNFPVAAKTGTTRNSRDNWVIGYTPDIIVGVWVGNTDNTPMRDTSGVTGAGPIFHDAMIAAMRGRQLKNFKKPEGIYETEICKLSGKLPTEYCPHKISEWFIVGTEPREEDDIFINLKLDKRNNLLARETCPQEYIAEKVFADFPPELKTWARENGWESPSREYSPLCPGTSGRDRDLWILIEKPSPKDSYMLDPLIPNKNEKITFSASAGKAVKQIDWYVDDEKIDTANPPAYHIQWQPQPGPHEIRAEGSGITEKRFIEVRE